MAEYYGVSRSDEYLAHYGVKGMKWGVRKAIASGNDRALGRQFRKARKKLAKLEKQAASGKKYAKRAAALGAGAALAGGVAATGTQGISAVTKGAGKISGNAMRGAGVGLRKLSGVMSKAGIRGAGRVNAAGIALGNAGRSVKKATGGAAVGIEKWGNTNTITRPLGNKTVAGQRLNALSNNTIVRGAGALTGAGLAGAAGYNAYRAATTKRAGRKAAQFRSEMQKSFAGTRYANQVGQPRKKKRR